MSMKNTPNLLLLIAFSLSIFSGYCQEAKTQEKKKSTSGLRKEVSAQVTDTVFQNLITNYDQLRISRDKRREQLNRAVRNQKGYSNTIKQINEILARHKKNCSGAEACDSVLLTRIEEAKRLASKTLREAKEKSPILKKQCKNADLTMKSFSKEIIEGALDLKAEGRLKYNSIRYDFYIVDHDSEEIRFHLKDPKTKKYYGSFKSLLNGSQLAGKNVRFVANGGMFTKKGAPQGLFVDNGIQKALLDTSTSNKYGNFYLYPNGAFCIDSSKSSMVIATDSMASLLTDTLNKIEFATQSGPMLVIDGKVHPKFNYGSINKHIRNGVGIMEDGDVIFIISDTPTTFYDFATVFKDFFGCENALYLDGAISKQYMSKSRRKDINGGGFGPMISVVKKRK